MAGLFARGLAVVIVLFFVVLLPILKVFAESDRVVWTMFESRLAGTVRALQLRFHGSRPNGGSCQEKAADKGRY